MSSEVPAKDNAKGSGARASCDHVARLVDRYFEVQGNELCIGGIPVSRLAKEFGTPLFVYDQDIILRKIDELRSAMPEWFQLYY